MIEDPSNQFVYTANFNDSSVTGLTIDQNSGNLTPLSSRRRRKTVMRFTALPHGALSLDAPARSGARYRFERGHAFRSVLGNVRKALHEAER